MRTTSVGKADFTRVIRSSSLGQQSSIWGSGAATSPPQANPPAHPPTHPAKACPKQVTCETTEKWAIRTIRTATEGHDSPSLPGPVGPASPPAPARAHRAQPRPGGMRPQVWRVVAKSGTPLLDVFFGETKKKPATWGPLCSDTPRSTSEAAAKPQLKWAAHLFPYRFASKFIVLHISLSCRFSLHLIVLPGFAPTWKHPKTLSFFAPYRFTRLRDCPTQCARLLHPASTRVLPVPHLLVPSWVEVHRENTQVGWRRAAVCPIKGDDLLRLQTSLANLPRCPTIEQRTSGFGPKPGTPGTPCCSIRQE